MQPFQIFYFLLAICLHDSSRSFPLKTMTQSLCCSTYASTFDVSVFGMSVILLGVECYLPGALVCNSLMLYDIEHFCYICLFSIPIYLFFGGVPVQIFFFFFFAYFKLGFLFSDGWVFRVLCIFKYTYFIKYVFHTTFIQVSGLSFHYLSSVISEQKFLIVKKSNLSLVS